MKQDKTVLCVVEEFTPAWEQVKKVINQYPGAFVMCHNKVRGYYFEVDMARVERELGEQQAKAIEEDIAAHYKIGQKEPSSESFIQEMERKTLERFRSEPSIIEASMQQETEALIKQVTETYESVRRRKDLERASLIPDFNLSDFTDMLKGQDYTQETIQEITDAIESYQSSLEAKRTALRSLTSKIEECKELAIIMYGKEIKVEIVFNHD